MAQAKSGDTVKVHYTGRLDDGYVFDTSANRNPLQLKIGQKGVIQRLDGIGRNWYKRLVEAFFRQIWNQKSVRG